MSAVRTEAELLWFTQPAVPPALTPATDRQAPEPTLPDAETELLTTAQWTLTFYDDLRFQASSVLHLCSAKAEPCPPE